MVIIMTEYEKKAEAIRELEADLNHADRDRRLAALSELAALAPDRRPDDGGTAADSPAAGGAAAVDDSCGAVAAGGAPVEYVNNHIHTTYSFSPYSPAKAAYMAWSAGLTTAGIMDHDSVAGAREFIRAGELVGIATTVGLEFRCSMANTPFSGRLFNNPDQKSVAYLTLHGIPHQNLDRVREYTAPYRAARNVRSRAMGKKIDALFAPHGVRLDFERDVRPASNFYDGGAITERHLLFALANRLVERFGRGEDLLGFLSSAFGVEAAGGAQAKLRDPETPFYEYHLLGLLKSRLMKLVYIDAAEELPPVREFLRFAGAVGGIAAYPYLGDVSDSVTGDKEDQAFEDAYLDELVPWLAGVGFHALTYMPARNTRAQLDRVIALCERHALFQISGEDINSPFQSFTCPALADPTFSHLITSTWALIGHEKAATRDPEDGLFTARSIARDPGLKERIDRFAALGRGPA
ncbi:MAG: PHP domain-containing protein [Clostridiales bacterium]|jgi:hypothetical protein|nr:PHP domain-containing protein [Clostridiales bacterium]